jgi:predicted RND superfamily exporter protein
VLDVVVTDHKNHPISGLRQTDFSLFEDGQPQTILSFAAHAPSSAAYPKPPASVFCQIGLVMLIGLASKNAILIVEFAERLQERGLTTLEAAVEAARIRLRPILMTSLAFILGVLPLMLAHGAGAAGRISVGTTVFGGMIAATTLNLIFVPVLYVTIRSIVPRKLATPAAPSNNSLQ